VSAAKWGRGTRVARPSLALAHGPDSLTVERCHGATGTSFTLAKLTAFHVEHPSGWRTGGWWRLAPLSLTAVAGTSCASHLPPRSARRTMPTRKHAEWVWATFHVKHHNAELDLQRDGAQNRQSTSRNALRIPSRVRNRART